MRPQILSLKRRVKILARDEDGGAYTLSYVMVIPVLVLLICLVVETTLMMSAKLGTVYAAYSGARTAVVWASASNSWSSAENRIERAAIKSFVPFASSGGGHGSSNPVDTAAYTKAYAAFANDAVSETYVQNKYRNAAKHIKVTTNGPPTSPNADITVTVECRFRFSIPGVGKLLGEEGEDGAYYFPVTSSATLQNEGPNNSTQTLGIGYGKLE